VTIGLTAAQATAFTTLTKAAGSALDGAQNAHNQMD